MKNIYYLIVIALVFASCNNRSIPHKDVEYKSFITGLASPVKLNFDTTLIRMKDYFADVRQISEVTLDDVKLSLDTSSGHVIYIGSLARPIGNLHVVCNGANHDIPVFASEKVRYKFSYKTPAANVRSVQVAGSMNGWNRNAANLVKEGENWTTEWILNKGLYQYRIWEDGKEKLDINNPEKADNGMGGFNNTFYAGTPAGAPPVIITHAATDDKVEILALDTVDHVVAYFEK